MSKEKGIFEPQEGFASGNPSRSPFSVDETSSNPFASSGESKSPFASDSESKSPFAQEETSKRAEPGSEKGGSSEPFASGTGKSPFSYEPPVAGFGGSPFEGSPPPSAEKESPFGVADEPKKEVPKAESSPFGDPAPAATPPAPAPEREQPAASRPPTPPPAAPAAESSGSGFESESGSIRQLELRAIFGVDRELSESEIIQRSRSLPGIRNVARVPNADVGALETVTRMLGNLGFGDGKVKLFCGNAPVEFIREGRVLLAVQNDGSFAPGVRETLMIVARELGRM